MNIHGSERLADWCVVLANRVEHEPPEFRAQLIIALGIGDQALHRWMIGRNKPDSKRKVQTLIRHIPELSEPLRRAFPQFFASIEDTNLRISAPYAQHALDAYAQVEQSLLQRTITQSTIDGLVAQLDPNNEIGIVAFVAQLAGGEQATHLVAHAWSAHGTGIWFEKPMERSYRVGSNSLCGLAVLQGDEAFYPRDGALAPVNFLCNIEQVKSAAAYPILRSAHRAGALMISSMQPDFFTADRRDLILRFARMLSLAFHENDFYAADRIKFHAAYLEQQYLNDLVLVYPGASREELKERAQARIREN